MSRRNWRFKIWSSYVDNKYSPKIGQSTPSRKNALPSKRSKKIQKLAFEQSKSIATARNQYQSGTRWLVWLGIISLLAVGGWFVYSYFIQNSAEPITVKTLSVHKRLFVNYC